MSYEIERHKRVLSLRTDDKRFSPYLGETLIYLTASACNNVTPRTFEWDVIAVDHSSEWNGETMLPKKIWEMGYWADGGGIKPNDRNVAGLTYVKQWKDAVAGRYSVLDSANRPLWYPRVSIWVGEYDTGDKDAADIEARGVAAFAKQYEHNAQETHDTFRRLHPEPVKGGSRSIHIAEPAQFFDALHLYTLKYNLPFSYYLTSSASTRFLADEPGAPALR
jgi:hypothetical protein